MSDNISSKNNETQEKVYCICRSSESKYFMILCDYCQEWFHGSCIGVIPEMAERIDKYYCILCTEKDPLLKITYKKNKRKMIQDKGKNKKITLSRPVNKQVLESTWNSDNNNFKERKDELKLSVSNEVGELQHFDLSGCMEFVYGESDNVCCERLPSRINQLINAPSSASELRKKFFDIKEKLRVVKVLLEAVDIKVIKIIEQINEAKDPGNKFVEFDPEDTTPIECILCEVDVEAKSFKTHLENCYMIQKNNSLIHECKAKTQDVMWNVFCNFKISKRVYCEKLRFECPLHYNDYRENNEVCGYPLTINNGVRTYCGNVGKTCCHENWEELLRLKYDLKKINLIVKFNSLKEEEKKIDKMASAFPEFNTARITPQNRLTL